LSSYILSIPTRRSSDLAGNVSGGSGEIAPGHTAWIVKFRAPEDPIDIGPLEYAYASMARAAGIDVPEHKLIASKKGPGYFATRRSEEHTSELQSRENLV